MTQIVSAAQVGLGVGAQHARAFASLEGCRLHSVFDIDPQRVEQIVGEIEGIKGASSFEAVIADPKVNMVSIASYDDAHFEQATAALEAGKNVFVEKPLCRNSQELKKIRAIWEANNKPWLSSNLVLRAAPLYTWLRDQINDGALGEIYSFDGDYLYGRLAKITHGWRGGVERYSVMQGGGIHLVDLMLTLTDQKPVAVTAVGNAICTRESGFSGADYVSATYHFPSGLIGRITANFGSVHPHQHVVRVFGTRATFIHDDRGARLHRGRDDAPDVIPIDLAPVPESKAALIPEIIKSIRDGVNTMHAAQREFDLMSACFAADKSLEAGVEVEVDYL